MKKYLKIILWTVPAVIFVGFMIALMVLNNSEHGKVYKGVAKIYDESQDGAIAKVDIVVEFNGDDELEMTRRIKGQSQTYEYLCYIEDGDLYMVWGTDYDYMGEIDAYSIDVENIDSEMIIHDLKCSKNITLRNVFITFMVIGILGLLADTGYVVYELLKKKGIIKVKQKPSIDGENVSTEENANTTESVAENK